MSMKMNMRLEVKVEELAEELAKQDYQYQARFLEVWLERLRIHEYPASTLPRVQLEMIFKHMNEKDQLLFDKLLERNDGPHYKGEF
jgi:hypothetical protein